MADIEVKYQYQFRGLVHAATAEVDQEVWSDMDAQERIDFLADKARDEFDDEVSIVKNSINDED